MPNPRPSSKPSPRFFDRDADGTVRLRIRLTEEEASRIEEAAGETPLLTWIYATLDEAARRRVAEIRRELDQIGPPR